MQTVSKRFEWHDKICCSLLSSARKDMVIFPWTSVMVGCFVGPKYYERLGVCDMPWSVVHEGDVVFTGLSQSLQLYSVYSDVFFLSLTF